MSKHRRRKKRHYQCNGHHSGNGQQTIKLRRGQGSLRFQLSAVVELRPDFCPVCGIPLGSWKSWHLHLFGDRSEGPRCPKVRAWLQKPYRSKRRLYRRQTYPA